MPLGYIQVSLASICLLLRLYNIFVHDVQNFSFFMYIGFNCSEVKNITQCLAIYVWKKCLKQTNYNQLPGAEYIREFITNRNNSVNVKKIEGLARHIYQGLGLCLMKKRRWKISCHCPFNQVQTASWVSCTQDFNIDSQSNNFLNLLCEIPKKYDFHE